MERWIIIGGGATVIVGGLGTILPQLIPQWIGIFIVVMGAATMMYGFFVAGRPKPAYYGTPMPDAWIWNWQIRCQGNYILPLSRLTPLKECARVAYEKTRGSNAAEMAERQPDGREGILSWYAHALTARGDTTLYGKKPPATKYEVVPNENMGKYHFVESLSAVAYHGKTKLEYEDLRLKRSGLRRKIKDIKSW